METTPKTKTEYTILRDGKEAHRFTGYAENMLHHLLSLKRRFPNAHWDVERVEKAAAA